VKESDSDSLMIVLRQTKLKAKKRIAKVETRYKTQCRKERVKDMEGQPLAAWSGV
jgi:hypothetical protein